MPEVEKGKDKVQARVRSCSLERGMGLFVGDEGHTGAVDCPDYQAR